MSLTWRVSPAAVLLLSANPLQAFTAVAGIPGTGSAHLIVDVNGWFE